MRDDADALKPHSRRVSIKFTAYRTLVPIQIDGVQRAPHTLAGVTLYLHDTLDLKKYHSTSEVSHAMCSCLDGIHERLAGNLDLGETKSSILLLPPHIVDHDTHTIFGSTVECLC